MVKEARLAARSSKVTAVASAGGEKKVKEKKEKSDEAVTFVNATPKGEKKGTRL